METQKDIDDSSNVIMELRAGMILKIDTVMGGLVLLGAGGLEASLFTAEMFQMYQK